MLRAFRALIVARTNGYFFRKEESPDFLWGDVLTDHLSSTPVIQVQTQQCSKRKALLPVNLH